VSLLDSLLEPTVMNNYIPASERSDSSVSASWGADSTDIGSLPSGNSASSSSLNHNSFGFVDEYLKHEKRQEEESRKSVMSDNFVQRKIDSIESAQTSIDRFSTLCDVEMVPSNVPIHSDCTSLASIDRKSERDESCKILGFLNNSLNMNEEKHVGEWRTKPRKTSKKSDSSKYRGVCLNQKTRTWKASIKFNKRNIHLGYFDSMETAARAVDTKAKELHGADAILNFPDI